MDKRFTEGISGDGAVIIDNGRPITITEILDNLNRLDELEQLLQANVSQCNEQLMATLRSRVLTIQSEPDGIVRETMIDNLLVDINCG